MAADPRRCADCQCSMDPYVPRLRRDDGNMVCPACHAEPRGGMVTSALDADYADREMANRIREARVSVERVQARKRLAFLSELPAHGAEDIAAAILREAHDSGDNKTCLHCPFCGSGQVIGSPDGTISCSFCGSYYTVQVQPEFSAMPQTVNGVPYPMPGMPGSPTDTAPGADAQDDVDDAAQQNVPPLPPGKPGDAQPPDRESKQPNPFAKGKKPNPFAKKSVLVTATGHALPPDEYLAYLAANHADDRDGVLRRVRALHTTTRESR